jgi:hypothetical protein
MELALAVGRALGRGLPRRGSGSERGVVEVNDLDGLTARQDDLLELVISGS